MKCAGELIFLGELPPFVKLRGMGLGNRYTAFASIAARPLKGNAPEAAKADFCAPRAFFLGSPCCLR